MNSTRAPARRHITTKPESSHRYTTSAFFTGAVQPKLTINTPGDKYEQEADTMADHVMRASIHLPLTTQISPLSIRRKCSECEKKEELQRKEDVGNGLANVQRKCPTCEEDAGAVQRKSNTDSGTAPEELSASLSSQSGKGNSLDRSTLTTMNDAFGHDFAQVRIHTGTTAAQMNQSIQAKAFTHGRDIYFNQHQYNPSSNEGRKLLAHELTHVVQQTGRQPRSVSRKLKAEPTYPSYLINQLPGRNAARDPASRLTPSQRIAHVEAMLRNICPDFQVNGTSGIVSPVDPTITPSQRASGTHGTGCCCLHIFTRPASTNNWRILVSDVVGPHTLEPSKVVVVPGPGDDIRYGHWTPDPSQRRVLMNNDILLGHELCGHAGLYELNSHPPHSGRLSSAEHDPTVNIQNLIASEQGVPASDLRGLAAGGSHRGESFARIVISGYPLDRISPFSIPDPAQRQKLFMATRLIQANDFFVDIVGHTDSSGTNAVNDRVSADRARVIKGFIAARVSATRHLDRHDPSTPVANRFRSVAGVRDTQPPDPALQGNADNWRRVEIFLASFPAATNNPPANTPTATTPVVPPSQAQILAGGGDDCEKKIVMGAYPGITPQPAPAISPMRIDPIQRKCRECNREDHAILPKHSNHQLSIQRKVMHMSTITDRLTRSASDWAVTDGNVHDVLVLLNQLNNIDFRDTVAAMERNGYVSTLFDEVGSKDKENFATLLRKIQLNRTQRLSDGTVIRDSCTPANRKKLDDAMSAMSTWSERCLKAVIEYIFDLQLAGTPDSTVSAALNTHFFHQKVHGDLPAYRKEKYAEEIRDKFQKIKDQKAKFTNVCAQPFDPLCRSFAAYVSDDDKTVNACSSLLRKSHEFRTMLMFHEYVHVHTTAGDTGYRHERIYPYLTPVDAINNADSYTGFAVEVLRPSGVGSSTPRKDKIEDSSTAQNEIIQMRLANAARMITNALNVINDADNNAGNPGGFNEQFFKTRDRSELKQVAERFLEAHNALNSSVGVEYESSCDNNDIGYNRHPGSVVHICPMFFRIGEDSQTDHMLVLILDRKTGGKIKSQPGTADFTKQDKEDAYKNLWTYVAYSRAVSERSGSWSFLKAENLYEREIKRHFNDLSGVLIERIVDEFDIRKDFNSKYLSVLESKMIADLKSRVVDSQSKMKSAKKHFLDDLKTLMSLGLMVSAGWLKFSTEAAMKRLLTKQSTADAMKSVTDHMERKLKEELMQELDTQFKNIRSNKPVDLSTVKIRMDARVQTYIANLRLLDAYIPYAKEAGTIESSVFDYMQKLKSKLPAGKQAKWESDYMMSKAVLLEFDEWGEYNTIADEIIAGKAFNKKSKPGDPMATIKKYKKELDEEFKKEKAKK